MKYTLFIRFIIIMLGSVCFTLIINSHAANDIYLLETILAT
jgi:hypothetical protein